MKRRLIWIYNIHTQNFLGEYDVWPEEEDVVTAAAGYRNTEKFRKVLESYHIQTCIIKNKL